MAAYNFAAGRSMFFRHLFIPYGTAENRIGLSPLEPLYTWRYNYGVIADTGSTHSNIWLCVAFKKNSRTQTAIISYNRSKGNVLLCHQVTFVERCLLASPDSAKKFVFFQKRG